MKVAIYGRRFNQSFNGSLIRIFEELKAYSIEYVIYKPFSEFIETKVHYATGAKATFTSDNCDWNGIDMLITIGGDGTMLEAVTWMRDKNIPILGINSGRLGFLANVSKEYIVQALEQVMKGEFTLEKRSLIEISTEIDDFQGNNFALNEVALQKYISSSMIKVNAWYNDEFINTYWSDGLIVSTPTGSSAYSLSCGGPIVHPDSESFVLTPIAPHNLTVRPLVVSDNGVIRLKIEGKQKEAKLSLDYRSISREFYSEIIIKKAKFNINLVKLFNINYFSTLQKKLMWGVDLRN
jgi:NAD+ kinase